MKKNFINYFLSAILLAGLTFNFAACKDDDDPKDSTEDPNNNGDSDEEAPNTVLKYWDVVGQLVGIDQYTENYQDATFEPTIGEAEGNTRYIATNDLPKRRGRDTQIYFPSVSIFPFKKFNKSDLSTKSEFLTVLKS